MLACSLGTMRASDRSIGHASVVGQGWELALD
jgi:hypothetical protein